MVLGLLVSFRFFSHFLIPSFSRFSSLVAVGGSNNERSDIPAFFLAKLVVIYIPSSTKASNLTDKLLALTMSLLYTQCPQIKLRYDSLLHGPTQECSNGLIPFFT